MDFDFESEQERKALTASDEAIYPELRTTFKASLTDVGEYPMRVCSDLQVVESLVGNYDRRPGRLPLTSHDLQDFIGEGFASLDRCFNILWNNGTKWETDIIHGDGFHSVICFRTIEFMVRPLHALNADDPTRLLIGPGDIQDCLNLALNLALNHDPNDDPNEPMKAVMGRGFAKHPKDIQNQRREIQKQRRDELNPRRRRRKHGSTPPPKPQIAFEWRIDRATEDQTARRVQNWRRSMCGTSRDYHRRLRKYHNFLESSGDDKPEEGTHENPHEGRKRTGLEPGVDPQSWADQGASQVQPTWAPQQGMNQPGKRPSGEMGAIQEFGPSSKRHSTGSSQWGSGSQSAVSSPEISRPPSVAGWAQPMMGPPAPMGQGQPGRNIEPPFRHEQYRRGSRGSRGSISSAASRAGSRMAELTFQSPREDSPEGMGPPRVGSLWTGPEGAPRRVPGHLGGRYEAQAPFHGQQGQAFAPQIPGHGYQGPGQVQQTPAYGQLTEVFGHMVPDFQGPRQREPRVGIPHTQQFAPLGGWNPQHPGQQHAPVPPAPEQHPYQRGHEGFVDTRSGSGYAGYWGRNMPAFGGSNVQGGGGYPPGFLPMQPAMHGGQFALPQQPQYMAAIPPGRGNDPSGPHTALLTASPELLDSTAAQSGRGSTSLSFPPATQPMHHPYMPPLPPAAMRNTDPAKFQAQTTLPPVESSYPSSMPPATRLMPAELVHSPEHEDVPADSEPESGSEPESESGSEPESEGEDDQLYHEGPPVTRPLLHPGGQGDDRLYASASPPARAQGRSFDRDPFMGVEESDDDESDDDNYHQG